MSGLTYGFFLFEVMVLRHRRIKFNHAHKNFIASNRKAVPKTNQKGV